MPATLAMQPLKLKEYLATGLPCVVSRLPATEPWRESLDIVDDPADFVEMVLRRIAAPLPPEHEIARDSLRNETWSTKAVEFNAVIESAIARRMPCPS
jgi:hypothetical protein